MKKTTTVLIGLIALIFGGAGFTSAYYCSNFPIEITGCTNWLISHIRDDSDEASYHRGYCAGWAMRCPGQGAPGNVSNTGDCFVPGMTAGSNEASRTHCGVEPTPPPPEVGWTPPADPAPAPLWYTQDHAKLQIVSRGPYHPGDTIKFKFNGQRYGDGQPMTWLNGKLFVTVYAEGKTSGGNWAPGYGPQSSISVANPDSIEYMLPENMPVGDEISYSAWLDFSVSPDDCPEERVAPGAPTYVYGSAPNKTCGGEISANFEVESLPAKLELKSAKVIKPGETVRFGYTGPGRPSPASPWSLWVNDENIKKVAEPSGKDVIEIDSSEKIQFKLPPQLSPGLYMTWLKYKPSPYSGTWKEVALQFRVGTFPLPKQTAPSLSVTAQPVFVGGILHLQYSGFDNQWGSIFLQCLDRTKMPTMGDDPEGKKLDNPIRLSQAGTYFDVVLPGLHGGVSCVVTLKGEPSGPQAQAEFRMETRQSGPVSPFPGPALTRPIVPQPPSNPGTPPESPPGPQKCNPDMPNYAQPGCIEPETQVPAAAPTAGQPCNPGAPKYAQPGCIEQPEAPTAAPAAGQHCDANVPQYLQPDCKE